MAAVLTTMLTQFCHVYINKCNYVKTMIILSGKITNTGPDLLELHGNVIR